MDIKNSLKGYGIIDLDDIISLLQEYRDEVKELEQTNEDLEDENENLKRQCSELEEEIYDLKNEKLEV